MRETKFLYNVYGRFQMEVVCQGEGRTAYRIVAGQRSPETDFVIPDGYSKEEICVYLDDMLHELAKPGQEVVKIEL